MLPTLALYAGRSLGRNLLIQRRGLRRAHDEGGGFGVLCNSTRYPLSSSSRTSKRRNHASLATVVFSKGAMLLIVPRCKMPILSATIGRRAWFSRMYAAGGPGGIPLPIGTPGIGSMPAWMIRPPRSSDKPRRSRQIELTKNCTGKNNKCQA